MSKRTSAADQASEEQVAAGQAGADLASQLPDTASPAVKPAADVVKPDQADAALAGEAESAKPADPGSDRPSPQPLWEDHEHVPSAGGSFIRMPDGSLVKEEEA